MIIWISIYHFNLIKIKLSLISLHLTLKKNKATAFFYKTHITRIIATHLPKSKNNFPAIFLSGFQQLEFWLPRAGSRILKSRIMVCYLQANIS